MNANEIMPSCAIENGTLVPAAITPVAAAEPAVAPAAADKTAADAS